MKNFKTWFEQDQSIKLSIISILPDELKGNKEDEEKLLQLNTRHLGSEIIHKLKNLGIISSIKGYDVNKWNDIIQSIENGITIDELINKINF